MRTLFLLLLCPFALSAADRVPAFGLELSSSDKAAIQAGVSRLEAELAKVAANNPLLPEAKVFHKAVNLALIHQEFYKSNEIQIAHKLIDQGIERARALADKRAPWIETTGLVVRAYVSKIDDSIQPYGLVVPNSFASNPKRPYRLDVWLHGRDNFLTELKFLNDRQRSYGEFTPTDTIVLHPYGRYCNAFKFAGETDVFEAIDHVRKHYAIDATRISIRGFSMGGGGTWHLAAHYPSFWAGAAPGAGFAETAEFQRIWNKDPKPSWYDQALWRLYDATLYAANFHNLPVIAYSGEIDRQKQAADIMAKYMAREDLELKHLIGPKTEHRYEAATKAELDKQFTELVKADRNPLPHHVRFTTYTLRYNSNYWINVDGLGQHWARADVDAEWAPDEKLVRLGTTNVTALTVRTPHESVEIDGQKIKGSKQQFVKHGKTWKAASESDNVLRKRHDLQGPIDDAFFDRFIMVQPSGASAVVKERFSHATDEWRSQFRGDPIIRTEEQLSAEDIASSHLIVWGDPDSSKLVGRIAKQLPITWSRSEFRIAGKAFSRDKFLPVLIYPNPLNPKRYVVLNTGFTFCEYGRSSNALQVPKLPDYAVLELANPNNVPLAGFFDEEWKITDRSLSSQLFSQVAR
ncbi:MAG TPA: prolyl oligopeptidase family serine peptidase [Verrucomicrobiae bacterium]|nr:prolyl oligopeptidase family serine peptidase [Verrucomicrobiae bacterium]